MPLFTSRLNLESPLPNDPMQNGDLVLAANYQQIDSKVGATICTSGTRPGVPFLGQVIYETDSTYAWVWNGTIWKSLSHKSGTIMVDKTSTGSTVAALSPGVLIGSTTPMTATFTATAGRTYRITATATGGPQVDAGSCSGAGFDLRWAAGATVTTAGTLISQQASFARDTAGASVQQTIMGLQNFPWAYPGATQQITIGGFLYNGSAGNVQDLGGLGVLGTSNKLLVIEDF